MKQIFKLLCAISIFATISLNANNDKPFVLHDSNAKAYEMKLLKNGLDFGEYKGKVVLMVFFGKMCPPCLMEIPHLVELQKKLKDKLQILAIHVQSPMSDTQMNDFIKRFGINYRVFKNDAGAGEFIDFIMYNLNWRGQIPFMVIFDSNGDVKDSYLGMQGEDFLTKEVEKYYLGDKKK